MDQSRYNLLSIGIFATAAQLSIKALRLYDQLGILKPAYIDPDSGYRYYRSDQLAAAKLIRLMRQIDMPLATIRRVLAADPVGATAIVEDYRRAVEARVELVRRTTHELLAYLNKEEIIMAWDIEVRDAPPQPVVSIVKHTRIDGLDRHIGGSIKALNAFVAAQGGAVTGAPFGIYHGPVNADDNGPVEVCLPVRSVLPSAGDITAREIPAGRVASVSVSGAQCAFPAILEAYDAVCDWIVRNGYEIKGSPWEIWVDSDQQMQIAWPFREREAASP